MRLAIYGYGNIGRGVELAAKQNSDVELVGVFTRRDPKTVKTITGVPVFSANEITLYSEQIDVVVLCGGSATDLPILTPQIAESFNVVDSFDTHARISEHFDAVNNAALKGQNVAIISGGWDPGLFSLARLYGSVAIPNGKDYTFWGRGVSQGHSDAIRRIDGVLDARQYTVPINKALEAVRSGSQPELSTREKHYRECYVVAAPDADKVRIEKTIKEMPNYFADYDTTVTFITESEMRQNHSALPHGGFVIRTGTTGKENEHKQRIEFKLELDSNPEFTSGVLVALARAAYKLNSRGETGCKTIFDIAPADLSPLSEKQLREKLL